ncbi:nuclear transport factor 2 family protein [Promethearchaeum syntrophicum]|uniref:Nuclear transport factor 2 family protein n=1 Tax=Promethearchaeum syntrophicum TaxID=2594042 RepID=A0A5B9DFG1_9ARCH|nr:nuclear transport factor 2 family protein [Candidatus Prometheoarchaeum syntrophicum]QEE17864.1 Putative lumazine-binding protein [Candidatus Prometheoarchaeum syntrophicum]
MNNIEIPNIVYIVKNYIDGVCQLNFELVKQAWIEDGHRWIIDSETDLPHKMLSPSHKKVIKTVPTTIDGTQTVQIQSIDYSGNAAMAKIEWKINFPDWKGIEINYLLLLKGKNGWKIVSKNAFREKL